VNSIQQIVFSRPLQASQHIMQPSNLLLILFIAVFLVVLSIIANAAIVLNQLRIEFVPRYASTTPTNEPACNCAIKEEMTTSSVARTLDATSRIKYFLDTALSLNPLTDKVTTHSYQTMYGLLLLPFYETKPNMKILEIGLGCTMTYGPGGTLIQRKMHFILILVWHFLSLFVASVTLWKKLFPNAELWEAEYNAKCVEKAKQDGMLDGISVLVGDQSDNATLDRWIQESNGADFDIVIDDGGHSNCMIYNSFNKLWPRLKAGGLYFIEDIQGGHSPKHHCEGYTPMGEVVGEWNYQLIFGHPKASTSEIKTHRLPERAKFITCQQHACVIGKL
jgi:hypothetical protein